MSEQPPKALSYAEYEDLPKLIGQLKRAAIDSYMRHETPFSTHDTHYEHEELNTIQKTVIHVARPSENGEGGGETTRTTYKIKLGMRELFGDTTVDNEFKIIFDGIRGRIDKLFDPWLALPSPFVISDAYSTYLRFLPNITESPSVNSGPPILASSIGGEFRQMELAMDTMAGTTAESFKANFLTPLRQVVANLQTMSIYCGAAFGGEAELFASARKSIAEVAETAVRTFRETTKSKSANFFALFTLVKIARDGIKAYMSGDTSAGGVLADMGLNIINNTPISQEKIDEESANYTSPMAALTKAIHKAEKSLREAEELVASYLKKNLAIFSSNPNLFNIKTVGIREIESIDGPEELSIGHVLKIRGIVTHRLPAIADFLSKAHSESYYEDFSTAVSRPAQLGLGIVGPAADFHALLWEIQAVMLKLRDDVLEGGDNLGAASRRVYSNGARCWPKIC